jgi:hypothetical protein
VQRVGDLRVAGYSDPLESRRGDPSDPDRIFSFAERPDGDREEREAREAMITWLRGLEPRPDVVMVHQNGLAQALAKSVEPVQGRPRLVILTGHDHQQHVDIYDGAVVVDGGTAGAGGIFGAATSSVGVASLYFERGGEALDAVDLIKVEPLSGAAQAERVIPASEAACDLERVRCHD